VAQASGDEPAPSRAPWLLYAGLGAVVWGLFVPDQGLWHDDVQNLFRAYVAPGRGEGWFPAIATPTRRLLGLPFLAALASGHPVLALHVLSGLAWLATGVLADRLARRVWPRVTAAAPLAGALTLCATPDFFTDAPLAVAYQLSIVAYLGALLLGLRFLQTGSRAALVASPVCLSIALWTADAALAAWALSPLVWLASPGTRGRRLWALALAWFLVPVPYLMLVIRQLTGGGGYLRDALVPLGAAAWLRRCAALLVWNVTPWRWGFDRPLWFPSTGTVVPQAVRIALAAAAGAIAAFAMFRKGAPRADARTGGAGGALACVALAAATNVAFASVQLSDLFCRTHLLARVFVALALAWCAAWAWARATTLGGRVLVPAAVAAWLALGVAGALERQDYFVGYTRAHRQELESLLAAVPGLAPDAHLLLRVPPHRTYLATEAGYLARAWATLLYEDSSVECRVFLWSSSRPTTCRADGDGFECRGERSPDCQRRDGRETERLPYDRLVLVEYDASRNAYVLAPELPADARSLAGARYQPHALLTSRPRTRLARALLEPTGGLADRLWP
jgi:hypothetical protein